jgi:long-subunit acyl-CoA synthetase (AMP-forming)
MVGYRNNQKANDEVFYYKNGKKYYRTGDLGRLVDGRFLKITGRIKEQFKLENGKFVVPAPLEDIYARGPFIAQSFLYGVNKVNTILLVVPNYVEIESWAKTNKRDDLLSLLPEKPADLTTIGKTPEQIEKLEKLFNDEELIDKITKEVRNSSTI